jgi:putative ABC transport system permease protein
MAMKTPLAWHNLWHQPLRSGVAILGVTFATVLMFMQLGFLEAVKASATVIYDVLDFDICIRSRDYNYFSDARAIDSLRVTAAQAVEGVESTAPLLVGVFSWRNPSSGEPRAMLMLGVDERAAVFKEEWLQRLIESELHRPMTVVVDSLTRREFGPKNGKRFGPGDYGRQVEINDRKFQIAGVYRRGTGLYAGGAAMMSQRDFHRCLQQLPADQTSLGLIRVREGHNVRDVAAELRRIMPPDVDVVTRDEAIAGEIQHWVWETNYGLIFQSGVIVAVIVGTAIVYQVLSSEVSSLMPEYATLKAMGYANAFMTRLMLNQSLLLALVAFGLSFGISLGLYEITAAGAQIPIRMTSFNVLLVLALTLALCAISGLAAIRKAFHADPAELF